MAKIKHLNVLNLRACCWSLEEKLLIYDYIPNGDIASAIQGFGLGSIVDMRSSEIRSDQISPMEISSPVISRESYYQAPEASKITKPSQKWDVYSFGLVVLEMVTEKSLVVERNSSETDLVMWVESASERNTPVWYVLDPVLAWDRDMEESMVQVIKIRLACVQKIPDKRPLMRSLFESFEKLVSDLK